HRMLSRPCRSYLRRYFPEAGSDQFAAVLVCSPAQWEGSARLASGALPRSVARKSEIAPDRRASPVHWHPYCEVPSRRAAIRQTVGRGTSRRCTRGNPRDWAVFLPKSLSQNDRRSNQSANRTSVLEVPDEEAAH